MFWCKEAFPVNDNTVELLSFDPGLVNAGVIHVRVDTSLAKFCVLHAALINVCNPLCSFALESSSSVTNSRKRKPEHVEPFSYFWPNLDFAPSRNRVHDERLENAKTSKENEELKFEDQVALMSFALQSVDWLNGSDPNLDFVLVEVQDPVNAKMRSVGHSVQTFYESSNAKRAFQQQNDEPLQKQLTVRYVSSRLKLSDAVLSVLGDQLKFGHHSDPLLSEKMRSVISTRSHAAKKSSALQVFKVLSNQAPEDHPFFVWIQKQKSTKHNILDALLQTFGFLMQEAIGFPSGVLNGSRKALQKEKAQKKKLSASIPIDKESIFTATTVATTAAATAVATTAAATAVQTKKRSFDMLQEDKTFFPAQKNVPVCLDAPTEASFPKRQKINMLRADKKLQ